MIDLSTIPWPEIWVNHFYSTFQQVKFNIRSYPSSYLRTNRDSWATITKNGWSRQHFLLWGASSLNNKLSPAKKVLPLKAHWNQMVSTLTTAQCKCRWRELAISIQLSISSNLTQSHLIVGDPARIKIHACPSQGNAWYRWHSSLLGASGAKRLTYPFQYIYSSIIHTHPIYIFILSNIYILSPRYPDLSPLLFLFLSLSLSLSLFWDSFDWFCLQISSDAKYFSFLVPGIVIDD